MSKLLQIADNWIDPNKVIAVVPVDDRNEFLIHVDMGSWTASYDYEDDPNGWGIDSCAETINAGRS